MKKDRCRAAGAMLCVPMLLFALCACASEPQPERVSDEELASLREQYPYNDQGPPNASMDFAMLQTWDVISSLDFYAIAEIELTSDWWYKTIGVDMFGDGHSDQIPGMNSLCAILRDAEIKSILWGGGELQEGDEIVVFFGSTMVESVDQLSNTYHTGGRYVCMLSDARDTAYKIENLYSTARSTTFCVTEQDVVLAATSWIACIDECSGMYLDTLQSKLTDVMRKPDAEIDDPTPPLETE